MQSLSARPPPRRQQTRRSPPNPSGTTTRRIESKGDPIPATYRSFPLGRYTPLMSDRALVVNPNVLPSGLSGPAAEDLALLVSDQADSGLACFRGDQIVGRCALWWTHAPPYALGRLGVIGHFSACDRASAVLLLNGSCEQLASQGCRFA